MRTRLAILAASVATLIAPRAFAQTTLFWDGGGATGDWAETLPSGLNWVGNLAPTGNEILNFAGTTNLVTNNNLVGYNGHRILFTGGPFVLGGNAITLFDFGTGAPKIENNSNALQTISLNVTMDSSAAAGNIAEINPVDGSLQFDGTVSLVDVTELRIFGDGLQSVTFNGAISGTGSGLAIKQNSVVTLNSANTFTGNVAIDAGELRLGVTGALAAGPTIFLGNGATTDVPASLTLASPGGGQVLANNLSINPGDGLNRTINSLNTTGTNTITGNIAMDGTFGQNRSLAIYTEFGGTLEIHTGVISGAGQNLEKTGGGTLVLGGTNTYTGITSVFAGTLSISADANIGGPSSGLYLDGGTLQTTAPVTLAGTHPLALGSLGGTFSPNVGADLIVNGGILGSGSLAKGGAGTLTLTNPANAYAGSTTVNAGTLLLGASNVLPATPVTVNGGSLNIDIFDDTVGAVTLVAGSIAGTTGVLTASAYDIQGGSASAILAGTGGLAKNFGGTATLTGANTFTGGVQLNGGTLSVNADAALGAPANSITFAGGALNATTSFSFTRAHSLTDVFGNGLGADAGQTLSVDVPLTGPGGFAKIGNGTLQINVPAANLGTTAVNNGVLALNTTGNAISAAGLTITSAAAPNTDAIVRLLQAEQIPNSAPITISANGARSAFIDLNGLTETIGDLTVSTATTGTDALANGVRTGAGGTLILNGNVTFNHNRNATGNTGRELLLTATGSRTTTVSGGGTLDLGGVARTFTVNSNNAQANTNAHIDLNITNGGIIKEGTRLLVLNGSASTFTGGITVNAGTVTLTNASATNTFSGGFTINAGGTLQANAASTSSALFNQQFGAPGNAFTLNGGNFQANYGVNDRTLIDRLITITAAGGTITANGTMAAGTFVESNITQLRLEDTLNTQVLTGTGTLTKNGGGRLTLNDPSPGFSGAWIVNNGTLEAAPARLGDNSATNVITLNGGNWAIGGDSNLAQITLNGGALSPNGATRTINSPVAVTAPSFFFANDFWSDTNAARTLQFAGVITAGANDLTVAVNRPNLDTNSGTVSFFNPGNTMSGTISVGENIRLLSSPSTGTGTTIGTAAVVLAGGQLALRDNGTGSDGTLAYGNNVSITTAAGIFAHGDIVGTATLNVDRVSGTNTGNTFQLGTFTIGAQQLNVTGANGYSVSFAGAGTMLDAPTFNPTTANLAITGGLSGDFGLTKIGAGKLTIGGATTHGTGLVALNEGSIQFNSADSIPGTGANISAANATAIIAGYAMDQAFLARIVATANTFVAAVGADSGNSVNLTGFAGARLGGSGAATYSGALTPATPGAYRLGGGEAGHVLTIPGTNLFTGASTLDVGSNGTGAGVIALTGTHDFSGTITLSGGELLRPQSNASLGNPANTLVGDGGGIQFAPGAAFDLFALRTVNFGAGGFILDTNGNDYAPTTQLGNGGAGGFTKVGAGVLTLGAASTYAGPTTVSNGVLVLADTAFLGTTSSLAFGAGTTFRFTGSGAGPVGRPVAFPAGGGLGIHVPGATGTLTFNQAVSGGPAAGSLALTLTGSGVTEFTAVNTFTGNIVVDASTLSVPGQGSVDPTFLGAGAKTITLQNGATLRTTGTLNFDPTAGSKSLEVGAGTNFWNVPNAGVGALLDSNQLRGAGTLVKNGTGRVAIGSTQTNFTGHYINAVGQTDIRSTTALGSYQSLTLQGGTLRFQNNGTATPGDINFANYNPVVTGDSTLTVDRDSANAGNTIVLGNLAIGANTLTITNANTYKLRVGNITLSGSPTFNVGGTTNSFTVGGVVSGAGLGFTKLGTQPMTLGLGAPDTTPNTYTGLTTISAGTLNLAKQPNLTGSGGVGGGAIVGDSNTATADIAIGGTGILFLTENEQIADTVSIDLNPGGVLNLNGKTETIFGMNFNGGSLVKSGGTLNLSGFDPADLLVFDAEVLGAISPRNVFYVGSTTTATIASVTLSGAVASHTFNVANGAAADDLSILGVVDGAGHGLTKTGPGVLLLAAGNTFGGAGSVVNSTAGSIAYTDETALGDAANTIVVSGGGLLQPRGLLTLTRLPQIGTGGGGFDIPSGQTTTISSGLANVPGQSGALVKGGPGTLILDGTYAFDGGVTATAGSLKLHGGTGNGPIGPGPITVAGGTVELRNDVSNVYGNHVNPTAAGTLVFSRVGASATNQTLTLGDLGQGGTGALTLVGAVGYTLNVANINLPGGFLYGNSAGFPDNITASNVVVAPGGNVSFGSAGTGVVRIGSKNVASAAGTALNITFDATAAASFIANAAVFEVAVEPASGTAGTTATLKLPPNASITATTNVTVGDSNNQGATGNLQIGNGTTSITTPTFTVGGRKGNATVAFVGGQPGTTLNVGNGAGRTNLNVAVHNVDTGISSSATMNLTDGAVLASLGQVIVGSKGANSATSTGANSTITGNLNLGNSAATNVSMVFDAGSPLLLGRMLVTSTTGMGTKTNAGTLTFGGGSLLVSTASATAPGVVLGSFTNTAVGGVATGNTSVTASGTFNLTGGNVTVTTGGGPAIAFTPENTFVTLAPYRLAGALSVSGGSLSLGNDIAVGVAQGATTYTSTLALSGGTLDLNGNDIGAVTNFNFTGGTLRELGNLLRPLTQNGVASEFLVTGGSAAIAGAYTLTSGSATIDAGHTLAPSGNTTMASGELEVNGTLTGTLDVSGGVVSGLGVLGATTLTGGTLAPGITTGQLDTGNLTLGAASTFAVEIGGSTAGTGYDQVYVTGAISLAGTFSPSLINGFAPTPNQPFYLMLNDGVDAISGTFAGLPEGEFVNAGGHLFNITYAANGDGGAIGNDVALVAIPEPGTATLLLGGLALLAARRRRK